MSNSNHNELLFADLDRDLGEESIRHTYEEQSEEWWLECELTETCDVGLLAGKATSARRLHQQGICPSEWRHAIHKAKMAIGRGYDEQLRYAGEHKSSLEGRFVKAMLDLGRPYAIARYARWERLDYRSVKAAILPLGIRALITQLLEAEGIARTRETDASISNILDAAMMCQMTAYRRTGMLQGVLHRIADQALGHAGGTRLDRNRMRAMLSLARLHFSRVELRLTSIAELQALLAMYEVERSVFGKDRTRMTANGRPIRAWRQRHIQPLLNLYPYAIRHGLRRAIAHEIGDFDHDVLVNELATAHCGILLMRRAGLKARLR